MIDTILRHKLRFFFLFFVFFSLTYGILYALDALPEPPLEESRPAEARSVATGTATGDFEEPLAVSGEADSVRQPTTTTTTSASESAPETAVEPVIASQASLPQEITIDALGRTLPVLNPQSRTIADLDQALLSGVVRHPDSATLTREGTIFILGHSSYLPSVRNRYFQAFNGIQELEWGDTIRLRSTDAEHVYRVDRVYRARAQEVVVPIAGTGPKLTLATCNSFGSVDDRYVVEASRIDIRPL